MPRLTKAEWELVRKALVISVSNGETPGIEDDFAEFADQCAALLEKKFHRSAGGGGP